MAVYHVTAPDGTSYEVTGPDGASEADVLAHVQSQHQPAASHDAANSAFWDAQMKGDQAAAQAALQQLHAAGGVLTSPQGEQSQQLTAQAAQNTVNQQGFADNAVQGFGKSFVNTGQGIQQLGASVADAVSPLPQTVGGLVSGQQPSRLQQVTAGIDANAPADAALNRTGGGLVGQGLGIATQLAIPVGELGAAANLTRGARIAQQAALGAGYAGLQGVPTGGSRAANMVTGGALQGIGQAVPEAFGAMAQTPAATAGKAYLAQLADQYKIPVRLAQLSNNPLVQAVSSIANKFPGSGGQAANQAQREAVNRAVSQTFGENVPAITSDVYNRAINRIGGEFNALTARNNMQVTMPVLQKAVAIQNDAAQLGTKQAQDMVNGFMQRFEDQVQNGVLPGRAYQTMDTKIGNTARSMAQSDPNAAHYLRDLRGVFRDAMDSSITPQDQAAWQQARSQYGNLKTVRDLIAKDTGEGINPQGLMGRVTGNNAGKEAMARGNRGALGDIAKVSSGLLKDQVPDSGTVTRSLAASLLGGGGYAAAGPAGLAVLPIGAIAGRVANSNALAQLARSSPAIANKLASLTRGLPYLAAPIAANAEQQ